MRLFHSYASVSCCASPFSWPSPRRLHFLFSRYARIGHAAWLQHTPQRPEAAAPRCRSCPRFLCVCLSSALRLASQPNSVLRNRTPHHQNVSPAHRAHQHTLLHTTDRPCATRRSPTKKGDRCAESGRTFLLAKTTGTTRTGRWRPRALRMAASTFTTSHPTLAAHLIARRRFGDNLHPEHEPENLYSPVGHGRCISSQPS